MLEGDGPLLVSTDLHGNFEDLTRLHAIWRALGPTARWVLLGDLVHGPNDQVRVDEPELYGYEDRSEEVALAVADLVETHPERVFFVLGNHDHVHVGGPRTRKFHRDEGGFLEAGMTPAAIDRMRALFQRALLLVTTSCGASLSHGAPPDCIARPSDLDGIALPCRDDREQSLVLAMTCGYGQSREVMERFLRAASVDGPAQRFVIHGHDRAEEGYFVEAENQLCPTIFGAPRANKRCVVLDLGARYDSVRTLRDGVEIRRLYD